MSEVVKLRWSKSEVPISFATENEDGAFVRAGIQYLYTNIQEKAWPRVL